MVIEVIHVLRFTSILLHFSTSETRRANSLSVHFSITCQRFRRRRQKRKEIEGENSLQGHSSFFPVEKTPFLYFFHLNSLPTFNWLNGFLF